MACACDGNQLRVPPTHVFTTKSTTDAFIALSTATSGGPIDTLRARLIIEAMSGNMSIQLAYQYSGDLSSWTTVSAFSTARLTNGTTYEADIDMTDGLFYRFGVLVKNNGSTANCESALVSLELFFSIV
jgi:hypothetical protein